MVRELVDGVEKINQPAGHLEPGESIEQAVVRETLEETGYEFVATGLCGVYRYLPDPTQNHTYLRFAIAGTTGLQVRQQLDSEIICAEWMTVEAIEQSAHMHRSPMVLACVLDYLHKPSYPLQVFNSAFT